MDYLTCDVCFERFNSEFRRPKLLDCGHTVCLACVRDVLKDGSVTCPMDRQVFCVLDPEALKDNFHLLSRLEFLKDECHSKRLLFWCMECLMEADEACVAGHTVCSLRTARTRAARDDIDALERDASLHGELLEALFALGPKMAAGMQRLCTHSSAAQEMSQDALTSVNQSLELAEPEWKEAETAVRRACAVVAKRLPRLTDELLLLKKAGLFKLEVLVEGSHGASWSWRAKTHLGGNDADQVANASDDSMETAIDCGSGGVKTEDWSEPFPGDEDVAADAAAEMRSAATWPEDVEAALRYLLVLLRRSGRLQTVKDVDKPSSLYLPSGDKSQPELSFRFTLDHISCLHETLPSRKYYACNLPWRIVAGPNMKNDSKYLRCCLECVIPNKNVSCKVEAALSVLPTVEEADPICRAGFHEFTFKESRWGWTMFALWDELVDPKKGYVKDDTIVLEVHLKVDTPLGIDQ